MGVSGTKIDAQKSFKFEYNFCLIQNIYMDVFFGTGCVDWEDSSHGVMYDTICSDKHNLSLLLIEGEHVYYMSCGASLLNAFSVDSSNILLISFLAFFTMSGEVPSIKR